MERLLLTARMIDYSRLKAPSEHLGVLIEPEPAAVRELLLKGECARLSSARVLDVSLLELRTSLRRRLGLEGPVIVTGHQPEFYHAGVFAKVLAAHHLAEAGGARAVFLTVDSDVLRSHELAVPEKTHHGLRRLSIPFMDARPELPAEWLPRRPLAHWLEFFTQVSSTMERSADSLLPTFVDGWRAAGDWLLDFCDAMGHARAAVERALGHEPAREIRVSELSSTPEFRVFVAHAMLHARELAQHYNDAQAAFRRRFGVRNRSRPVPPLSISGDLIELPFWICPTSGARRRLGVVRRDDWLELFADHEPVGRVPAGRLACAANHGAPWERELGDWQIRPRALILSGFARLFLSDLFIHGLGGATYDAMTEDFVRSLLGVDLPPMACVTATLHLPLERQHATRGDILSARHRSRDIRFNPQRYLQRVPPELLENRRQLVSRSEKLRAVQPDDHAARRVVSSEIRRTNESMLKCDPWRAAELDQQVEMLERAWQLDRIAMDREYFYALHPRAAIEELSRKIRGALHGPA